MSNNRRLVLISIITTVAVSVFVAFVQLRFRAGFSSDIRALVVWSMPFAIAIGLIARTLNRLRHKSFFSEFLKLLLASSASAYGWVVVMNLVLGVWARNFSFSPFFCWIIAGAAGLAAGTQLRGQSIRRALTMSGLLLASIITFVVSFSFRSTIPGTIVYRAVLIPSERPLTINNIFERRSDLPDMSWKLPWSEEDLRRYLETGTLEVLGHFRTGDKNRVEHEVLLIGRSPVMQDIDIPLPKEHGAKVAILVEGNTWHPLGPAFEAGENKLTLMPSSQDTGSGWRNNRIILEADFHHTLICRSSNGGRTCSAGFKWRTAPPNRKFITSAYPVRIDPNVIEWLPEEPR